MVCGVVYYARRLTSRFCSCACSNRFPTPPKTARCVVCKVVFSYAARSPRLYCTKKCANQADRSKHDRKEKENLRRRGKYYYYKPRPKRLPIPCKTCKRTFVPYRANNFYCSLPCKKADPEQKRRVNARVLERRRQDPVYLAEYRAKRRANQNRRYNTDKDYREMRIAVACFDRSMRRAAGL